MKDCAESTAKKTNKKQQKTNKTEQGSFKTLNIKAFSNIKKTKGRKNKLDICLTLECEWTNLFGLNFKN